MILTDLAAGTLDGPGVVKTRRTVGDLAAYFENPERPERLLYETSAWPHSDAPGALLWGTTILQPGRVGEEFFMTRGHRHLDPAKGELTVVVSGRGLLVLKGDEGERTEAMSPGSTHWNDGATGHRAVNVGDEPLVFLTAWDASCGHDYAGVLPWPGMRG